MNIQHWLLKTTKQLARLDAEMLLMHTLQVNRTYLYTHGDTLISEESSKLLNNFVEKHLSGMPIAYILGEKEFWSMTFKVSPDVLIPRPETEHLVETLLDLLDIQKHSILELGTGSGAVAIALAKERPNWKILACDNSEAALLIAKENATRLLPENSLLSFQYSHWFNNIPQQQFCAIISNPPYIANNDPHLNALKYEPSNALISGSEGLNDIQEIITQSIYYLKPSGYLLLEHGNAQASAIRSLLQRMNFTNIKTIQDLAGHDRITLGTSVSTQYVQGEINEINKKDLVTKSDLKNELKALEFKLRYDFLKATTWTGVGVVVTLCSTLGGMLAHGFHWI